MIRRHRLKLCSTSTVCNVQKLSGAQVAFIGAFPNGFTDVEWLVVMVDLPSVFVYSLETEITGFGPNKGV